MFEVVRYRQRGYLEYFYTVIRIGTEFMSPVKEEPVVRADRYGPFDSEAAAREFIAEVEKDTY